MSRPTRARLRSSINPHPRVHRHVGPALVLTLAWLALPADTAALDAADACDEDRAPRASRPNRWSTPATRQTIRPSGTTRAIRPDRW